MAQSSVCFRIFVYLLLFCEVCSRVSALQLGKSISSAFADASNSVSRFKGTQLLTDATNAVTDGSLKVATVGLVTKAAYYTDLLLFTRDLGDNHYKVEVGQKEALLKAGFGVSKPTKILIHGWLENHADTFTKTLRKAFLTVEDMNVISCDWHKMSRSPYPVAFTAAPYVGTYLASLVDFLVQDVGVDISSIHMIGFSLGAHIAAVAAKRITCGQLTWITGLDPAGPSYTNSTKDRLLPSDALFVDVVHTTAGLAGYADPCGQVDFYPNGGFATQPGCLPVYLPCSHHRAYKYYAESITSEGFIATRCNSWTSYERGECALNGSAVMGYHVDKGHTGVYYLNTNSKSPFAKGGDV